MLLRPVEYKVAQYSVKDSEIAVRKGKGYFHEFVWTPSGLLAVIELEDGTVELPFSHDIRFLDREGDTGDKDN